MRHALQGFVVLLLSLAAAAAIVATPTKFYPQKLPMPYKDVLIPLHPIHHQREVFIARADPL